MLALLALNIGCLRSSEQLHSKLLYSMMRTAIGFYETTPSGRILNRFGKDVDIVDNVLPPTFRAWFFCFASVREISRSLTVHICIPLPFLLCSPVTL